MLDFPAGPALNQVYQQWRFDGAKWARISSATGQYVLKAGDTMSGTLTTPMITIQPNSGPRLWADANYSYVEMMAGSSWRFLWNKSNGNLSWDNWEGVANFWSQGSTGNFYVRGGAHSRDGLHTSANVWAGGTIAAGGNLNATNCGADGAITVQNYLGANGCVGGRGEFNSLWVHDGLILTVDAPNYYMGRASWDGWWRYVENNTEVFNVHSGSGTLWARHHVIAAEWVFICKIHTPMFCLVGSADSRTINFAGAGWASAVSFSAMFTTSTFSFFWGANLGVASLAWNGYFYLLGWTPGCDAAYKQDIEDYRDSDGLADILKLRPRRYRRRYPPQKGRALTTETVGPPEMGFIHQEIAPVRPEYTSVDRQGHKGVYSLCMLSGVVAALKDQETRLRAVEAAMAAQGASDAA